MANPVDQSSFAQLVVRFGDLLDQWQSVLRRILVQDVSGPGPVGLTEAAHGGKALLVANGAAGATIQLQLPADADVGVLFLVDQVGPAPVRFVPPANGALRHRLGHTGSAGQWAGVSVKCIRPGEWLLAGDTAIVA